MTEKAVHRRLAAILAVDVVGYSRHMQSDEEGTLAALKSLHRDTVEPIVSSFQGRVVNAVGDALLAEFGSAINAVNCAVELQMAMGIANAGVSPDKRLLLRAGVNLGDVMVEVPLDL